MSNIRDSRKNDGYERLMRDIKTSFESMTCNSSLPLFTTTACDTNLYTLFLDSLPPQARQHYNCRACREFVNTYGGLVTVTVNGETTPVMWDIACEDTIFADAVINLRNRVKQATVNGVFITSKHRLGLATTGEWKHIHVNLRYDASFLNKSPRIKTDGQAMAEKTEEYNMLSRACKRYSVEQAEIARRYLSVASFYRAEKFRPWADWFVGVKRRYESFARHDRRRVNALWRDVACAPVGFCHISYSVLGGLLDDIRDELPYESIKARYNAKVDPTKYMRPQAAPGVGNVKRAEELVKKLGIENSLKRRFARLDDLDPIWKSGSRTSGGYICSDTFGRIRVKEVNLEIEYSDKNTIEGGRITWEKFAKEVLPDAARIYYYVDSRVASYCAITTAVDPKAPPIMKWDYADDRCPLAWYMYASGSYFWQWNIKDSGWRKVTAIDMLPPMRRGFETFGNTVIFFLEDCKDTNYNNVGNALFPECLNSELYEVRSTIEAYSKANHLEGYDEADACGVCFSDHKTKLWDCRVRVTSKFDHVSTVYIIDRWG